MTTWELEASGCSEPHSLFTLPPTLVILYNHPRSSTYTSSDFLPDTSPPRCASANIAPPQSWGMGGWGATSRQMSSCGFVRQFLGDRCPQGRLLVQEWNPSWGLASPRHQWVGRPLLPFPTPSPGILRFLLVSRQKGTPFCYFNLWFEGCKCFRVLFLCWGHLGLPRF